MPGGPSERCRRHHGDDGTRFRGVCRGPAAVRAFGLLVRGDAAAVGVCPATAGGHVRWPGGGGAAAGDLPGLRPVARAAARVAAVTAEVRGRGDLRGAGAAGGRVKGVRGGGAAAAAGAGRAWSVECAGLDGQLVAVPVRRAGGVAAAAALPAGRPAGAGGAAGRVGHRGCAGRAGGGERGAAALVRPPGLGGGAWGGRAPVLRVGAGAPACGACGGPPACSFSTPFSPLILSPYHLA